MKVYTRNGKVFYQQQLSVDSELYKWLKERYVDNPMEYEINSMSDAVVHCVARVKKLEDKRNKRKEYE